MHVNPFMTRQPVYVPYKRIVFGFNVSTRLTNRVEFRLVGQLGRPNNPFCQP
jgi:hypothetical protein